MLGTDSITEPSFISTENEYLIVNDEISSDEEEEQHEQSSTRNQRPAVVTPLVWQICHKYFPNHNIRRINDLNPELPIPEVPDDPDDVWNVLQEARNAEENDRTFTDWVPCDPHEPDTCHSVHIDGEEYKVCILWMFLQWPLTMSPLI